MKNPIYKIHCAIARFPTRAQPHYHLIAFNSKSNNYYHSVLPENIQKHALGNARKHI
jgi:heat shock protein HspQ